MGEIERRDRRLADIGVGMSGQRAEPGIDGVQTIQQIWQSVPRQPCVICTAYADYNWEDVSIYLGGSGNLFILKKPFDTVEVLQLAQVIAERDNLARLPVRLKQTVASALTKLEMAEAAIHDSHTELMFVTQPPPPPIDLPPPSMLGELGTQGTARMATP